MKYMVRHKNSGGLWVSDAGNYLFSTPRGAKSAFNGSTRGGSIIDPKLNAKNILQGGRKDYKPMGNWSLAETEFDIVEVSNEHDTHKIAQQAMEIIKNLDNKTIEMKELIEHYEGEIYE